MCIITRLVIRHFECLETGHRRVTMKSRRVQTTKTNVVFEQKLFTKRIERNNKCLSTRRYSSYLAHVCCHDTRRLTDIHPRKGYDMNTHTVYCITIILNHVFIFYFTMRSIRGQALLVMLMTCAYTQHVKYSVCILL